MLLSDIKKKKTANYYLIEEQKEKKEVVLKGFPYWLTIDPVNFCNLQCPLCPTGQKRGSRPARRLSFDIFKKVIDVLGPYLLHIDFCNWGEPLLNDEIYEMVYYAKKFEIDTKLDTNFTVFDEQKSEKLINSGLDKIILSIDGASQETYQRYRKGGNFNKVLENIKMLIRKRKELKRDNPFIEWQFLVFRHNEHELEEAEELAYGTGVDKINFTPPYAGSIEWLATIEPFRSKYYEISRDRVEFKKSSRETLCNWLWDGITVNSDGSVSPCCSVEDTKDDFFENITGAPFDQIWNNSKYVEARTHVLDNEYKKTNSSTNICLHCDHVGLSNHMDVEYLVK